MKNNILIGWAEADITPTEKIYLDGQFYERISEYVETPITATAMTICSRGDHMILCSADLTHIDASLMKKIRGKVAQKNSEIDPEKIIVCATHTHTSFVYKSEDTSDAGLSAFSGLIFEEEKQEGTREVSEEDIMQPSEALEFISDKISEAIVRSWENKIPSKYAHEFGRAAVGMCRRVCYNDSHAEMWGDTNSDDFYRLEGGNDSGIELIFTYSEGEELTGIVINIACPAQVLEQRSFISSDYWGKVRALLREKLGSHIKILGICAPAGDQAPRDLVRWVEPETPIKDPNVSRANPLPRKADPSMFDIKGCATVARRIATEVLAVYEETSALYEESIFYHKTLTMDLPLRRVTEEEVDVARKEIEKFKSMNTDEITFKDNAKMHVHAGTVMRYERQQKESIVPVEIHVARLGNIAFATSPFELFLDYGNIIRARSVAEQTFLVQLACDAKGYLPTKLAEKGGHYSAYVSSGHVGHEGGNILVENTLDIIKELFNKGDNKNG